ncbi:Multidrug-efflux transporter [Anaerobiospirillum thomasii]|uniref:Multidrug-efflux transporter n=1 Tax=Anaerobiospirillum thomasii TaxID=179995 RepID=A0A2X0WCW0_9GAMM|nr:MATE family efflux transporter [Anaerobiospirillum thomasii]SPT68127.1 Multidrug-efflux transporter [Anaerobiospirillum thomasii]SPT70597.1 Multidrug-efflux transporter [Anaerobiospirillum thomasii]
MSEVADKAVSCEIVPSYSTEFRRLFKLFLPVLLGQLAQTSMGVVDTVMAGWAGTIELSGVAIGSSFFWPALLFVVGMSFAIQPIVAQLRGSGAIDKIPKSLHTATVICISISVVIAILVALMPNIYKLTSDINQDMINVATGYLYAIAIGIPGFTLFNILRAYCEGLGTTIPTLIFGFIALIINIPLNYIFIFGKLGMPAFGGVGCGIATTVTIYITTALMFIYTQRAKFYEKYRLYRQIYSIDTDDVKAFLKLGLPLGLSTTIEVACFSLVSFFLSPFGPVVVGAHSIALNISGLLFMIPLSLASCATIRVGEAMGCIHWHRALRTTYSVFCMGFVFFLLSFSCVLLFKEDIISLYTQDPKVHEIASLLVFLCCLYMLPDTLQVLAIGVLRGFKDSKTIFIVTVVAYWFIAMPIGYGLAYGYITGQKIAATGFWLGFICGLVTAAIIYITRLVMLFRKRALPSGMNLQI